MSEPQTPRVYAAIAAVTEALSKRASQRLERTNNKAIAFAGLTMSITRWPQSLPRTSFAFCRVWSTVA